MQTGAKTIKDIGTSLTGHIYTFVIKYSIDRTTYLERKHMLSFTMNMNEQYPPAPIVRPDLRQMLIMTPAVFMLLSLNPKSTTFPAYLATGGRLLRSRFKTYSLGLRLLAGITFIGLLAVLLTQPYADQGSKSSTKVTLAQIDSLEKALDQYQLDVRSYPTTDLGLAALNTRPQNLNIWAYHGDYDLFAPRADAQAQVGGTGEDANVTSWAL